MDVVRLDSGGSIKVGDFGLAEDVYNCGYFRQEGTIQLPYKWMALESLTDSIFSEKTDVVWLFNTERNDCSRNFNCLFCQ